MNFKGIVFDFDGTLANLTIDFQKIKRKIILLGEIFFEQKIEDMDEYPVLECIEILTNRLKELDLDLSKEFNTRCRLVLVDMEMRAARRGKLFPYTRRVLENLKRDGVKIGVISRNCTPAIKMVFPDIEKYIDVFLPREDVPKVKPHPIHVDMALNKMQVEHDNVLLVGDHPIDILCAKRAGVRSGAVASGKTTYEELLKTKPDFIEENIEKLYIALKDMNAI